MTTLIIGYPGSGKSALAERITEEQTAGRCRIYLATMIPYGREGAERVERHRRMRAGKGFITIEAPYDVTDALLSSEGGQEAGRACHDPAECIILLECVSNLAANLLFERKLTTAEAEEAAASDIGRLARIAGDLVIVSNHFGNDGTFDQETAEYASLLDRINMRLDEIADRTIILKEAV